MFYNDIRYYVEHKFSVTITGLLKVELYSKAKRLKTLDYHRYLKVLTIPLTIP